MKIDITRQDRTTREEKYDFDIAKNTGWKIDYKESDYPLKVNKSQEVQRSLWIEERYPQDRTRNKGAEVRHFQDTIFQEFSGRIRIYGGGMIGYSPVIDRFNKLPEDIRAEIRDALSLEARTLLDKGLEKYAEFSH